MSININELLVQLGIGSKETVYMSVSPVVGLEIIKVDAVSKMITAYANRPLEYNESLREIADYEEFKNAVKELCEELHISPRCNVVLNLPMVLFGTHDVPLILSDEAVTEVLVSEAEQTYTFKRHDPLVAWMDANISSAGETRKVFYSALQKDVVENIKNALAEIGATLVSVKTSLASTINALSFSGLTADQMQDNMTWNLVVVGLSGYSICSMQGPKIIEYYEEPLALKSFEGDELYNAINSSIQLALMNFPANFLYVVSDTDLVSAQLLASRLSNVGSVVGYLENNAYRKDEFIPTSLEILPNIAADITLEALGSAVSHLPDMPMQLEFMDGFALDSTMDDGSPVKIRIGEKEYEITQQTALKITTIICAVLLIPVLLIALAVPMFSGKLQTKLDDLNKQAQELEKQVSTYSQEEAQLDSFNVKREINDTLKNNRAKLLAYSALGETVPKGLWITYFFTQKDGKIDIKGAAASVEDVSTFYANLKDAIINSKLRLYRLEMATTDIEEAVENKQLNYVFEITNMSEAELKAISTVSQQQVTDTKDAKKGKNSNQDNNTNDTENENKKGIDIPKTLPFGLK